MIRMIYSQQNAFQLGVCPLLCALLTNSSMEQYGTLGSWLCSCVFPSVCVCLCVCVCVCVCVRVWPVFCSHSNWKPCVTSGVNLFQEQNCIIFLLCFQHNKNIVTKPCFDLSMISVSCVLVLKKRYNYAKTGPLLLLQWAASENSSSWFLMSV